MGFFFFLNSTFGLQQGNNLISTMIKNVWFTCQPRTVFHPIFYFNLCLRINLYEADGRRVLLKAVSLFPKCDVKTNLFVTKTAFYYQRFFTCISNFNRFTIRFSKERSFVWILLNVCILFKSLNRINVVKCIYFVPCMLFVVWFFFFFIFCVWFFSNFINWSGVQRFRKSGTKYIYIFFL